MMMKLASPEGAKTTVLDHRQLHKTLQPPIEPQSQLQQLFKLILACLVGLTLTALCSLGVER